MGVFKVYSLSNFEICKIALTIVTVPYITQHDPVIGAVEAQFLMARFSHKNDQTLDENNAQFPSPFIYK